jgi:hypothetical protein
MLGRMRIPAAALVLLALAGCGGASTPAATTGTTPPATTRPTFTIPPPAPPPIAPCKLTAAHISAVVGFPVGKPKQQQPETCQYDDPAGGNVWFRVDASDAVDVTRDKASDTFSLGGKYVTITDETGFPHQAFTAVKNPGDKSPGVIADGMVYLGPGHLQVRVYYPSSGKPPGRAHALTLLHDMLK